MNSMIIIKKIIIRKTMKLILIKIIILIKTIIII